MKKKLAVMAIAACMAATSVAGASQSVNAAPKLKLANEVEGESEEEPEEEEDSASAEEDTAESAQDSGAEVTAEPEEEASGEETEQESISSEETDGQENPVDEEGAAGESAEGAPGGQQEEAEAGIAAAEGATITVSGTGSSTVTPDGAVLYVGVETTAESSKEAQTENTEGINAVIEALLEAGVSQKDITTSSFDIYSTYDFINGSSTLAGYRVSTMLTVSNLDIDEVGALLDVAVDAGANDISGIAFTYGDTEEAYDQALEAALERANDKAELLAGASGGEIGCILSIEEDDTSYNTIDARTYSDAAVESASESGESMTVMAGETQITATVSVTYLVVSANEDEPGPEGAPAEGMPPREEDGEVGAPGGRMDGEAGGASADQDSGGEGGLPADRDDEAALPEERTREDSATGRSR